MRLGGKGQRHKRWLGTNSSPHFPLSLQFAVWTYIVFERDMSAAEMGAFDGSRRSYSVHAEMAEILTKRISSDQIPKRWQKEHGLRLHHVLRLNAFCVAIVKSDEVSV